MRVQDLMTRQVHSCRSSDSLEQAAQLMWNFDCGCVAVCDGDGASRLLGMITDRDICMSALFEGRALKDLHVSEAMSKSLQTCRASDALGKAERIMQAARIRRGKEITETEVGDTLASICASPQHSAGA